MRIWLGLILTHNKAPIFHKTARFTSEIITLFGVSPQLFLQSISFEALKLYQKDITFWYKKWIHSLQITPCSIITTNDLLMRIWLGLILTHNKTSLFHKTTQFTSEIITLFRVSPQLFHSFQSITPVIPQV